MIWIVLINKETAELEVWPVGTIIGHKYEYLGRL